MNYNEVKAKLQSGEPLKMCSSDYVAFGRTWLAQAKTELPNVDVQSQINLMEAQVSSTIEGA